MKRGLILLLAILFAAIAPASGVAGRAHAARGGVGGCVKPDVAALFRWSQNDTLGWGGGAFYVPVGRNGLRWMGAPGGGLYDGKLFVLACDGSSVTERDIGSVESMKPGPLVNGRPTVEVLQQDSGGTDILVHSVGLYGLWRGQIVELWSHEATSGSVLGGRESVIHVRWRYSADGRRIDLTGVETVGRITDVRRSLAVGRSRAIEPESFCWKEEKGAFAPCLRRSKGARR